MVGVNFDNCDFIECKFSNIQPGFSMKDCNVGGLIITQESFKLFVVLYLYHRTLFYFWHFVTDMFVTAFSNKPSARCALHKTELN